MNESNNLKDEIYHLSYDLKPHPEGIRKEDLKVDEGACDAIVLAPILYGEDGGSSSSLISLNGRTDKPLANDEMWAVWAQMAYQLAGEESLDPEKRALCDFVHKSVKKAILRARSEEAKDFEVVVDQARG